MLATLVEKLPTQKYQHKATWSKRERYNRLAVGGKSNIDNAMAGWHGMEKSKCIWKQCKNDRILASLYEIKKQS